MAKTIRVSEAVYNRMREIQHGGESLGEIVARLLKMYEVLQSASVIIKGQHELIQSRVGVEAKQHQVD